MKILRYVFHQGLWMAILCTFLFATVSFSQTKEIIAEGAYNMGDGETPIVAEGRSVLQAKRTALEQAGTYVESYSKVKNFQLTEDEIKVIASGLIEVTILDKKRTIIGDGLNFWVKIKAVVQLDKMEEMAARVKEKSVVEDYKRIQEAYDKGLKEIEELKRQLAQAKGEKEKRQVEARLTKEERLFQADEWFEKGYNYSLNKEYDKAIEVFTNAIQLDPNYSKAYNNRGAAYYKKGQYDRATEDYTNAIQLDPNNSKAYNNRGVAYGRKGQYDRAIEDYNRAIQLDPNDGDAYYNRGNAYVRKGQYDRAIQDYSKSIQLKPNYAEAYNNSGFAYVRKGQYDRAIEDYSKSIQLKPNYAEAFNNRGVAYYKKGQYDRAIEDYSKAIQLNPNYVEAFNNRGNAYSKKAQYDRAILDFQKACDMGSEEGCRFLRNLERR